jgi:hypothetical protein
MNTLRNWVLPVCLTTPSRLRRVVGTICFVACLCVSHYVIGDEASTRAKSVNSATSRPIVLVGPEELARLRKNAASKNPPLSTAWKNLLADANKALTSDYSPYIGSNSVEFAASGLAAGAAIRDLCLVFEVTGERRYANKAKSIMVAWATHQPQPGRNLEVVPLQEQKQQEGSSEIQPSQLAPQKDPLAAARLVNPDTNLDDFLAPPLVIPLDETGAPLPIPPPPQRQIKSK